MTTRKRLSKNGRALPEYVTLSEAARLSGRTLSDVQSLVDSGTLNAVMINGEIAVPRHQVPTDPTKPPRQGTPISISEGARKHGLPARTISRWVARGLISQLGVEKNRILIDEADLYRVKKFYRKHGGGQGKRILEPDRLPKGLVAAGD